MIPVIIFSTGNYVRFSKIKHFLEKRKKALQDAVRHHGLLTKQAMIGEGVDRHLFALCCVAMASGSMPDFLEKYKYSTWTDSRIKNWELSTR